MGASKERKPLNIQMGERIKRSRERAGITQEALAEKIDVTTQYISDLERGIVGTSIPTMIKICQTLNVSSDYILMGKAAGSVGGLSEKTQDLSPEQLDIIEQSLNLLFRAMKL